MPNRIQHKRSTTTRQPTLEFGELGYTTNGNILWIGQEAGVPANVIAVGGGRFPGVLTANQAIVVDGNLFIDTLRVGNTTSNAVINATSIKVANSTSNTTLAVPTTVQWAGNFFLHANGSWATPAGGIAGANTQIQFNDSGSAGAGAGLTFDKVSNTLTVSNTLVVPIVGANVTFVGNATVTAATITGNSTVTEVKVTSSVTNVQSSSITLAGTTTAISSNVSATANVVVTGAVTNVNSTQQYYNGTGLTEVFTTKTVTSNTQSYLANSTVTGLGIVGNSTATYVVVGGGATVTNVNATGINLNGTTTTIASNLAVNDTTVTITANTQNYRANSTVTGLAIVGNSTATVVTVGSGASVTNVVSTNVFVTATNTNIASTGTTVTGTNLTVTANASFNADVTIAGNLVVNGTTATINVDTITVEDSIIRLASNNLTTNTIDVGLYGVYGNSTVTNFSGIFRDTSNAGIWTVFSTLTSEPGTTVDTSHGSYARGAILADHVTEVFLANSTKVSITAGALFTDLSVLDGGTGVSVFANNGIVFGQNAAALAVTAAGTDGQVLQAGATGVPVFGMLDGGTF